PRYPLHHLHDRPGVAERHRAAVGDDREPAAHLDGAAHYELSTLALLAEAEGLELADDLEREGVVELARVDVLGRDARQPEAALGRPSAYVAVAVRRVAPHEVEAGRMLIGRPVGVGAAAQDVHGLFPQVARPL